MMGLCLHAARIYTHYVFKMHYSWSFIFALSVARRFVSKDENEVATITTPSVLRRDMLVEYPFTVSMLRV